MSLADDAIRAKLSALNETQDSISTVSQWFMFYRYGVHAVYVLSRRLEAEGSRHLWTLI